MGLSQLVSHNMSNMTEHVSRIDYTQGLLAITIPRAACTAVATAMVLLRTFVADTSQIRTKHTGPTEKS